MLSTDLRLLLDQMVPDPLARAIQRSPSVRAEYVWDLPGLVGRDDETVVEYATSNKQIVVTMERSFKAFKVCTNPGIIVLTSRERHEAIMAKVFQRFLRSGYRKYVKNSFTRLNQDEAVVTDHSGQPKTYTLRRIK